ncbi:MAG: electron transfer flavoprotein subunit alpha/FixB family protein [Candidatus Korarchaeota archaeon]|nr:electron transfer flavoprotein subunit alpha/FixB family protein [Thermoproteota archaeon]
MKEILILAEHRMGKLRDITFEVLTKGRELARKNNARLTAVIIGHDIKHLAEELAYYADEVLIFEDQRVREFHSEYYQQILSSIILDRKPEIILIPHTSCGIELAPSLAIKLNIPVITDVLDASFENGQLIVIREYFGGKLRARVILRGSSHYIATIRAGISKSEKSEVKGRITEMRGLNLADTPYKRVIELTKPPPEATDLTSADVIVAVGRGIGDAKNLPLIEELSRAIGGVIACSRPIIDMRLLPKERLVGLSGKVVKPKLYIAIGISGQFYHVYGMMNSELIVAINKDPNAPIFNVADYGIARDIFEVLPRLINKIREIKGE